MVIDYSEPYKDEIHNLLVKYGLNWTHSPGGIEFYKTGVDDTCNIAGYFTKKEYDKLVNWIKCNNISEEIRMMLNSPLGGRRGISFGLGRSWQRKSADWWLAGGIPAANCIAAYQPKGAASYEDSKINLANPGTYDAYEGVAPVWDAVNGWIGQREQYLFTGILISSGYSMIARYANLNITDDSAHTIAGHYAVNQRFTIIPTSNPIRVRYYGYGNSDQLTGGAMGLSGVMAITPDAGYFNGINDGVDLSSYVFSGTTTYGLTLLARARSASIVDGNMYGNLLALSLYNITITADQVSALTDAMQLL